MLNTQSKNTDFPLISVIIPSFNRAELIDKTIQSVLSQTFNNWELIIIDDGSIDNTSAIIKPYLDNSNIYFYNRPKERASGGNAARNYGLELSKGDYIKWLDSDDLLRSDCLKKQLELLSHLDADVVFCRSRFFNENLSTGKIDLGPLWNSGFKRSGNILQDFILGQLRFSNNDGLWRRNALPDRPYSEDLKNSQEFLMITRMLARNIKVELLDEVLVLVRSHLDQMGSKRKYSVFAKNQILARYLIIKDLKSNNILTFKVYNYLLKSMSFYIIEQLKRREFKYLITNTWLFMKSVINVPFKLV